MNLRLSFIFLITGCFLVNSQSKFEELTDYFEDFAELSREQIYVHLNKSEYISNETIWFKSYIFSRNFNEISEHNSNLYCVLFNNKNEIIKQKQYKTLVHPAPTHIGTKIPTHLSFVPRCRTLEARMLPGWELFPRCQCLHKTVCLTLREACWIKKTNNGNTVCRTR